MVVIMIDKTIISIMNESSLRRNRVDRKRIGRGIGSGTGKTSGHGHKGADARSGTRKKDLIHVYRRLPKIGFISPHSKKKISVFSIEQLNALSQKYSLQKIDKDTLISLNLMKRGKKLHIIGKGEITKLSIFANKFTEGAKSSIQQNGGSFEVV